MRKPKPTNTCGAVVGGGAGGGRALGGSVPASHDAVQVDQRSPPPPPSTPPPTHTQTAQQTYHKEGVLQPRVVLIHMLREDVGHLAACFRGGQRDASAASKQCADDSSASQRRLRAQPPPQLGRTLERCRWLCRGSLSFQIAIDSAAASRSGISTPQPRATQLTLIFRRVRAQTSD